jgi:hypothetical protein
MPRQSHLDAPGALHHIIVRGIERKNIFRDNKDRNDLLAASVVFSKTPPRFWAVREQGVSATALAERIGISRPAVSVAVERGEKIAEDRNLQLEQIL